jgi:hypothetical protein
MAASNAPGMPRKGIVGKRIGAVEADGHALHAAIDDHARNVLGHQRAVGGQRHAQTLVRAITRQLKNIRTEQRFAATQHQDGSGHLGNLIDDIARRFGGEIGGALSSVAWRGNGCSGDCTLWSTPRKSIEACFEALDLT